MGFEVLDVVLMCLVLGWFVCYLLDKSCKVILSRGKVTRFSSLLTHAHTVLLDIEWSAHHLGTFKLFGRQDRKVSFLS